MSTKKNEGAKIVVITQVCLSSLRFVCFLEQCDGKRPICSACINKSNHVCTWEVQDPSLSRTAALKSKLDEMGLQMEKNGNHLKSANSLIEYLMTRPEAEAHTILKRLRATQDIAATVQYVRDGDLLISGVLAPLRSSEHGGEEDVST